MGSSLKDELENLEATPAEAVLLLYRKVNRLLSQGDFEICDDLLEALDLSKLSVELQVGVLRIMFPARVRLKNWTLFRSKVHEDLESKNLNPQELLQGLWV